MSPVSDRPVAVIGAGPAGLTAALVLLRNDTPVVVVEATDKIGGISRTEERDGWRFDLGGHRFFTKVPEVERFWHEVLPDEDFLTRPRMSRIFYRGKLFDYPLKPLNALRGLGVFEAIRCVGSYVAVKVRPPKDQTNLEGWVAARFGYRLYRIFFKTYTEKVWGIPATSLRADWAAQRIKNLSLSNAIRNALFPKRGQTTITTLIDQFQYPKYGPGMMWERARDQAVDAGAELLMRAPVVAVHHEGGRAVAVTVRTDAGDRRVECSAVISSMPLTELVAAMRPAVPDEVARAAKSLSYRDFLTVALVVPADAGFPDNWIYIHSPGVKVGRVQNFGSWSPYMVKDGFTCLGLEYFVNEGDEMWKMADADLVEFATSELRELRLLRGQRVDAGYVVRVPKAYPVYDEGYQDHVDVMRGWLERNVPNVYAVGRNGMHRYNNQDHSMLTAMYAAENVLGADHDLWAVNVEQEYHEEKQDGERRAGGGQGGTGQTGGGQGAHGTGRAAPVVPRRETVADSAV
jgi:protoporphyrinogen oxidase